MLLIYTIIYFVSVLLYYRRLNIIASGLMIALAIFLYVIEYRKNKHTVNVNGFFAIGFIGGFGLSLLKLSKLSVEYSWLTIMVVFVAYFSIYLGSYFAKKKFTNKMRQLSILGIEVDYTLMERILIGLFIVTFLSFVTEAIILRFVPLFTILTPHAYSTFHVFMLHYVTSLYTFIPSFAIANYFTYKSKHTRNLIIVSILYAILMAILMLSRGQMIISIALAIFVMLTINGEKAIFAIRDKKETKYLIIFALCLVIIYCFITVNRAHDVTYLMGIFEMKDENIPIFIAQPYMYVAHNFENLNYMINNIKIFGMGKASLLPLFTLTLVKKIFPFLAGVFSYIIKVELSTKTLIYDFYYDFGIVGVIIACFIIGFVGNILEETVYNLNFTKSFKNYLSILFSLYCYYMLFSFLQSYFSLTDTWVYIIFLSIICIVIGKCCKRNKSSNEFIKL